MPPNTPTTITATDVRAGIPPELADTDSAIAVVTDFGSSEATTAGSAPIQRAINATLTIPTALPTRIATTIEITFPRML